MNLTIIDYIRKKIDTQGGIDSALKVDKTDSAIKAATQMSVQEAQFKQMGEKIGVDEKQIEQAFKNGSGEVYNQIVKGLAEVQGRLAGAKTASDIQSIATGDLYKNGGFEKLQADSSKIRTMQAVGSTEAMSDIMDDPKKVEAFIQKARDKAAAISPQKLKELDKDLEKSGMIDSKGNVLAENWVKAKSYLQANNMNSHNALVAGGMIISGALGEDPTVKLDNLDDTKTGSNMAYYNNSKAFHNAAPEVQKALKANNGDWQKAAQYLKTRDRVKYDTSYKNQLLDIATDLIGGNADINKDGIITDQEEAQAISKAQALGIPIATALGTMAINKGSKGLGYKGTTKLNKADLDKQGATFFKKGYYDGDTRVADANGFKLDENGKTTDQRLSEHDLDSFEHKSNDGYYNKNGKQIADSQRFATTKDGKRIERGVITDIGSKTFNKANNKLVDLRDSFTSNKSSDSTTDSTSNNNDTKTNQPVENDISNHHETPLNNITNDNIKDGKTQLNNNINNNPKKTSSRSQAGAWDQNKYLRIF